MNPHDREFAVATAALWKKGMDNYALCPWTADVKFRSWCRQARKAEGQRYFCVLCVGIY